MEIEMYIVTRFDSPFSRPTLQTFEAAQDAINYLALLNVTCIEEDADCPGCFDGLGPDGRIYSIEPEKNSQT